MHITIDELTKLFESMDAAVYIFRRRLPSEEIHILMPNHIITAMHLYPKLYGVYSIIRIQPHDLNNRNEKYRGIPVGLHHKNEVVVFGINDYFYSHIPEPHIIQLPNFKDEENRK